jgi:hypothetical protein
MRGTRSPRAVRIRALVCAVALVCVSCGGGSGSDESTAAKPVVATETGQSFTQPPRVTAVDGVLHLDLVASDRNIRVAGTTVRGQAYGNDIEGPTLVVSPGDTMDITLDNRLTAHTNLHFHGLHVSPSQNSDNIFLSINPGQKFHYVVKLPKDHPAGTFWYHSHAHTHSEEQVFGGLSGLIIVQGLTDRLPPALRAIKDVSFALKDAQVIGGVIPTTNIQSGAKTTRVVNSAALPVQSLRPGEVQLWRLANIGADIWYDLQLEHQQFTVIAEGRQSRVGGVDGRPPRAPAGQALRRARHDPDRRHLHAANVEIPPGRRHVPEDRPRLGLRRRGADGHPGAADVARARGPDSRRRHRRAPHRGVQREREEPVLHQRQGIRPQPRRRARQARHRRGVDAEEHVRRATPLPHPRQRLPGHVDRR